MSLSQLSIHVDEKVRTYTGSELRPHYLLENFGIKGTGLAAFVGPCEVQTADLVDWEDALNKDHIRSKKMLHLLAEFFEWNLKSTVVFQRLLVASLAEHLREKNIDAYRKGDDIWVRQGDGAPHKLTVSIVTASPLSTLMHLGINIDAEGAPVRALGLQDLQISWKDFLGPFLESVRQEYESLHWACAKVRPVV